MTATPKRQPPLVMIVDNDHHHLQYADHILKRFEYRVSLASHAEEAAQLAVQTVPAIVLTELDLPQMSGLDLLYNLRSEPGTAQVPVVALSRNADNATEARCLRAGFAAVLRKPVAAEELFRTVQAAVETTPRTNMRINAKFPVSINGIPLDCVEGECASVISEYGMYIRTYTPRPPRSLVAVRFEVNGRTIAADGIVLYSHRSGEGPFGEPGMGIKFSSIEPHDQEYLRMFINREVSEGMILQAP